MRYLKKYESLNKNHSEVLSYLKDIFIELEHEGFSINIKESNLSCEEIATYNISLTRESSNEKTFTLSDICDTLLFSNSYMNDNNWTIQSLYLRTSRKIFISYKKSIVPRYETKSNIFQIDFIKSSIPEGIRNTFPFILNLENLPKDSMEIEYIDIEFKIKN